MDILVLGDNQRAEELMKRIPKQHHVQCSNNVNDASLPKFNLVFDLNFDNDQHNLQYYSYNRQKVIIVGAVKTQLAEAISNFHGEVKCTLIGMNTLPGFIDRNVMEVSFSQAHCAQAMETVSADLNWDYQVVEDRVGMVSPRVLAMIINEACYTLQEGTATIDDIDVAMRLGTNYPYGPFEWADKIGIHHIYELLLSLYEDTQDERYKICPLLKTKYLKRQTFYATLAG
ncbi:MAG: 3-hydroxyacyl-CoA dehydrogenase family protein [Chitinophagales bacterium]|nr:3-hydroxyacyl-CoA dehydrogenase family protein [Chitinophagales bacterium]